MALPDITTRRRQRTPEERRVYQRLRFADPAVAEQVKRNIEACLARRAAGLPPMKSGGGPGDTDHPRRCHGVSRYTGKRCKQWALIGSTLCKFHCNGIPSQNPSMRYAAVLGKPLADKLQELVGTQTHAEQLALYEEIGVARLFLMETMQVAGAVLSNDKTTTEQRLAAMGVTRNAMDHVADLCSKMASIEKGLDDKISVRQLALWANMLTKVIEDHLKDVPDGFNIAKNIGQAVMTQLRLPAATTSVKESATERDKAMAFYRGVADDESQAMAARLTARVRLDELSGVSGDTADPSEMAAKARAALSEMLEKDAC